MTYFWYSHCLLFVGIVQSHTVIKKTGNDAWQKWKIENEKMYRSAKEESARFAIWMDNLNKITSLRAQTKGFSLSLNKFGDWTETEFRNMRKPQYLVDIDSKIQVEFQHDIPDTVDWRLKGCVTPVHDMGDCNDNWAKIAVDVIESNQCVKSGKLVELSEQNLLDCCGGAYYVDDAFKCVQRYGGIDTEESYPSKGCQKSVCKFNNQTIGAKISRYVDISRGNEKQLQTVIARYGPIAAIIDASQTSFQFYRSGIYDEPACSSTMLDHIVLIVGYGELEGKDYWLVKNSWGSSWGMNGYILMSRNKNNQCGIASMASYPIISN